MAAPPPNYQVDDLLQMITTAINLCDDAIVAGSKATIHQTECTTIARCVENIRGTLVWTSERSLYERPLRFILPLIFSDLYSANSILNECSPIVTFLTSASLVSRLGTLQNSLNDVIDDLFWIESLYIRGYRQDRVELNGSVRFTQREFKHIDQDTANAWCGIVGLYNNPPLYQVSAANDISFLCCGSERVVEEGAVTHLFGILVNSSMKVDFRSACAQTLITLVTGVEIAREILSTEKNVDIFLNLLSTSEDRLLIHIVHLISTIASTWEHAREVCVYRGVTARIIQIFERGLLYLIGLGTPPAETEEDPAGMEEDPAGMEEDPAGMEEDPAGMEGCLETARLKIMCLQALASLAKDSIAGSRLIGRSSLLVIMVRLSWLEDNMEVQELSLRVILHVTEVAERNDDVKRMVFGVDEASKLIFQYLRQNSRSDEVDLKVSGITALGNLSSLFVVGFFARNQNELSEAALKTRKLITCFLRYISDEKEAAAVRLAASVAVEKFTSTRNVLHTKYASIVARKGGAQIFQEVALRQDESTMYVAIRILCNLSYAKARYQGPISEALMRIRKDLTLSEEVLDDMGSAVARLGRY